MQDFRDNEKKRLQMVATVCILFLRFLWVKLGIHMYVMRYALRVMRHGFFANPYVG